MIIELWKRLIGVRGSARDRREYDRQSVEHPVRLIVNGATHDCLIADVSATGAFLRPHHDLPLGTVGLLELPGMGLRVDVTIRRRTDDGIGISFSQEGAGAAGAIVAGWVRGSAGGDDAVSRTAQPTRDQVPSDC